MTPRCPPPPCGPPAWSGLSPGTQSAIRLGARAQRCSHIETHDPSWTAAGAPATTTTTTLCLSACAQMTPPTTRHSELTATVHTRGFDGDYTTLFWAAARPRQYSGVVAPPARDHIASQALPRWRSHEPKPTTGMAALGWMQRGPSPASLRQRRVLVSRGKRTATSHEGSGRGRQLCQVRLQVLGCEKLPIAIL